MVAWFGVTVCAFSSLLPGPTSQREQLSRGEAMKTLLPVSGVTVVAFSLLLTSAASAAPVPPSTGSCSTRTTRRMPSAVAAATLTMALDPDPQRFWDRAGKAAARKAAACPSLTNVVSGSETCAMVSAAVLLFVF
jgi:hypothetical protein